MASRSKLRGQSPRGNPAEPPVTKSVAQARFSVSKVSLYVLCAGLYLLIAVVYARSIGFGPISLDDYSELKHASDHSVALWGNDQFGHFRPIKNLLFLFLAHDGQQVGLLRAAILVLFIVSTALVQATCGRLLDSRWAGLAVATLWSLHPMTAPVPCWLSTANLVLCLVGIGAYLCCGARLLTEHEPVRSDRFQLVIALIALLFAELSYELALVAPLALVAYCKQFHPGTKVRWSHPVYVGSSLCVATFIGLRARSDDGASSVYRAQLDPAWQLVGSAARHFATNTVNWLWPIGRFGVLLGEASDTHLAADAVCWVALIAACAVAWQMRHRDPAVTFGLTWFALFLAPLCNFVPIGNTPIAVHYLYVAGVGMGIAVVRVLVLVYRRVRSRGARRALVLSVILAFALGSTWVPETVRVVSAWRSDESLFSATLANYPEAIEPLVNLASFYLREQRYAEAKPLLDRSQRIAPDDVMVVRNVFSLLWQTNQPQAALDLLDDHPALRQPEFQIRRGEALERLGRQDAARTAFQLAFDGTDPTKHSDERFVAGFRLVVAMLRTEDSVGAQELLALLQREYPERKEFERARELLRGSSDAEPKPPP